MRITIVGAGSIGTHLAKYLSGEQMDIFIIDKDPQKLALLDSEYNLMAIEGDATEFSTLRQADVGNCELFIAVTDTAERNIVVCGVAKSMGARMTVARVDRPDYIEPHNLKVQQWASTKPSSLNTSSPTESSIRLGTPGHATGSSSIVAE